MVASFALHAGMAPVVIAAMVIALAKVALCLLLFISHIGARVALIEW